MQRASRLPPSIRWYLILALIGLAIGSLGNLFMAIPGYPVPRTSVAVSVALNALLMVGVVRFHSNAARWIFAVWIALAIAAAIFSFIFFPAFFRLFDLAHIIASGFTISANVTAVACLFTPGARGWFETKRVEKHESVVGPQRDATNIIYAAGAMLVLAGYVAVRDENVVMGVVLMGLGPLIILLRVLRNTKLPST